MTLGVSAYVDLPVSDAVVPYIGGGIGASRVDARFSRLGGTPTTGTRFDVKDWGFNWHLDAGIGIAASETTTIELGARYSRTNALEFVGTSGGAPESLEPRLSSWSAMIGVRQRF